MRSLDRKIHDLDFPNLYFPEIYCMQGGYKRFFELYPELCSPSSYVSMTDGRYLEEHKLASKLWKKKGELSPFASKCPSPSLFLSPRSFPSSSVSSSRASTPSASMCASPASPHARSFSSFSSAPSPLTRSSSSLATTSPLTRSSSSSTVSSPITRSSSSLSERRHEVESPSDLMFDMPSPVRSPSRSPVRSPQTLSSSQSSPEFLAFRRDPTESLGLPEFSLSRRRPNIRPLDLNGINHPRTGRRIYLDESDSSSLSSLSLPTLPTLPSDPVFGLSGGDDSFVMSLQVQVAERSRRPKRLLSFADPSSPV